MSVESTMSGPDTRPPFVLSSNEAPRGEFEPEEFPRVVLPTYDARFSVTNSEGEGVLSLNVVGSPRIVDQIMHAATDAFREEVER